MAPSTSTDTDKCVLV